MSLLPAKPLKTFAKTAEEDFCLLETDDCPDWQAEFGNDHCLKVEIGFGSGSFLIEMAVREPENNFIGMDFYFPQNGIQKLLSRIKNLKLKNIRVVYGDVRKKVPVLFQDAELDAIYINFPDPWPQKRHKNRRLINPGFVKMVTQKLTPEGSISMATDSAAYAEEILEYFNAEVSFQNRDRESGFLQARGDLPKSKYEKGFIYSGDKIHYLEYFRLPNDGKAGKADKKASGEKDEDSELNEAMRETESNDEFLIRKFKKAEANAKDACDLKMVADDLANAGDREWARKVYLKVEGRAEDSLDLNWLACSLCEKLGDVNWARKVYQKAEVQTEDSLDCNWLAYSLCENLGDKGWAERLYREAEVRADNIRELCDLADSVQDQLGDKEWTKEIYRQAESAAQDSSDFFELADHLCRVLNDREWAGKVYKKAEAEAEECSDLQSLAESLCLKLGDREWAGRVYRQAERKAQDSGDFCALADSISKNLDDNEWTGKLYQCGVGKAEESYEFRDLADSVCEKLGDTEWTGKLCKEAESRARSFYDFRWLAESLCRGLGDKAWAGKIYQQAESRAKDPSDFNRLADSIRENLEKNLNPH